MKIACIGWGSLIWSPESLPLKGGWEKDGPRLPVEFARESSDGRLTLVLTKNDADIVTTLWSLLDLSSVNDAKSVLAEREGISPRLLKYSIGFWDAATDNSHGEGCDEIRSWAKSKDLDGVVWTNLWYGLKHSKREMPSYEDVLDHFKSLSEEARNTAKEYVIKAPNQINTAFRRNIENDLGWK